MLAFFGEGGVIDHEDPVGIGQAFGHGRSIFAGHGRLVPTALVDERLERLLGIGHRGQFGRQVHPARKRFNGFAFALLDQATQLDLGESGFGGHG